jgi:DNA-directed RNA polymerase specialized sigma24 family protein
MVSSGTQAPSAVTPSCCVRGGTPRPPSELYARHAGTMHAWLWAWTEWAASDLTAETFARAWLSRARFRDERGWSALR